jgi:hypothetical protein
VRAPNLSELYAAPITVTVPGLTNPFNNNQPVTVQQNTIGNTALAGNRAQYRGWHRAVASRLGAGPQPRSITIASR